MLRIIIAASLAGVLATAAVAQEPTQTGSEPTGGAALPTAPEATVGATTPVQRDADPDKVICKTVKPVTGTRVSSARSRTKVCMTKREWDEQAREAQEQLNQRNRGVCSGANCSG